MTDFYVLYTPKPPHSCVLPTDASEYGFPAGTIIECAEPACSTLYELVTTLDRGISGLEWREVTVDRLEAVRRS